MASKPATPASSPASSASRRRILRIGILLNRTLIEERQIRERVDVSVGQLAKNTFSVPIEALPPQFTMFAVVNDKYFLHFTKGMDGRISDGAQPMRLEDLKAHGAVERGGYWSYPLSDSARGKIEAGEFTLLFQFIAEPPRQPKPMLPASVRGTLADRIDPKLSVIMAISIMLHTGIAAYARFFVDPQIGSSMAERAYNLTFEHEKYDVEIAPTIKADSTAAESAAAKEPEKAKGEDKKPAKPKSGDGSPKEDKGGGEKADAAALQEEAVQAAMALVGDASDPFGLATGDSRRSPGQDLGKQLEQVREGGKKIEVGAGSGRGTRADGDGRQGTGTGPVLSGQGGIDSAGGDKEEKVPSGRISVAEKQSFDGTSLTPDVVFSKIQSTYMSALKRCYKDYLKKDPSARGKVTLSFTVNETGRSVSNRAKGFSDELDGCIRERMDGWRFPVPKDNDGEATTADFQISLQLVPD
jgi:hypothetical protein